MGQLELQDSFAPYFDPREEIEVKTAGTKQPLRYRRTKTAASAVATVTAARMPESSGGVAKSPSPSHQMR